MCFIHRLVPSVSMAMTMYLTNICGFALQVVVCFKRHDIINALNQLCNLCHILNPKGFAENSNVNRSLFVFLAIETVFLAAMNYFCFYQEWNNYKSTMEFPIYIPPEIRGKCLAFVFMAVIFSVATGVATLSISTLLCRHIYLMIGNLVRSYRIGLKMKLNTQTLSSFIFEELKSLKEIASIVYTVDRGFNLCTLLQYCNVCSFMFITVSVAVSKDETFQSDWIIFFIILNLIIATSLFYTITVSGSSIWEEGEQLKKICLECSSEVCKQSIAVSDGKDGSLHSFFFLLESIRDAPLKVTGGGLFVIRKKIFLAMINAVVTYSIVMYQLND
ncbi:hypothetical protein AVEN_52441-1 [Araneus ventricosus]|uniref:Gustatory receptor n=1 Tax=Araneus ventricosus TaxID=182803 RepID=A0A4Y2CXD9_ARAVE|nr:hypothetical protein AVEN_52441-1 [Araneus ventricosus]